jgi:hypothetical protein
MQRNQNPIQDDALAFQAAFAAALGDVSRTTFHRYRTGGIVPRPDAHIGSRPAWRLSTIRATVDRLSQAGG